MVSFLHAADLHLGMRTTRFEPTIAGRIRESRFTALDNILRNARDLRVDFVIIAGDLFDDSTVDFQTARRAFEMLDSLPMPVYILPGNHDPLLAGGVWDRSPWDQPGQRVRLLKEATPVAAASGLTLFPCPVQRRTSMDDPTRWIAGAGEADGSVRIGVAHGSLKARENLPPDDHPIAFHAATDLGLDYLALGHWHSRNVYKDREGVPRTAYSGVHEPMRFQGSSDGLTGWLPYSGAGRPEFLDAGKGEVLHVRIQAPGAAPDIDPIEVGNYQWNEEVRELRSREDLDRLIQDVATRPALDRRLLRLRLAGVLDAESMLRLDDLRDILANRYLYGGLDDTGLHVQPTPDEMREVAGQGVLRGVLERLQAEAAGTEPEARRVAERAILLLYQIAKEARS
jgi:DNA repair exonuclease SbcCD nuclease subunit